MIVYINLLMVLVISLVCLGLAKIIYGYAKINKRIDCLITIECYSFLNERFKECPHKDCDCYKKSKV